MPDLKTLRRKLSASKEHLRREFGVKTIGLFGSYIKGTARKGSDVDILVEYDKTPGLFRFLELEEYLRSLLGVKVDLVMKSSLKPAIGKEILKEVVFL